VLDAIPIQSTQSASRIPSRSGNACARPPVTPRLSVALMVWHLGPTRMLLVNTTVPLPGPISGYLNTLAVGTPGYVFGGPLAVGDDVLAALDAAIG
jgi:hypothetical protein